MFDTGTTAYSAKRAASGRTAASPPRRPPDVDVQAAGHQLVHRQRDRVHAHDARGCGHGREVRPPVVRRGVGDPGRAAAGRGEARAVTEAVLDPVELEGDLVAG